MTPAGTYFFPPQNRTKPKIHLIGERKKKKQHLKFIFNLKNPKLKAGM